MSNSLLIDELIYYSYRAQRLRSPHIRAEEWDRLFPGWQELEERYQEEVRDARCD